MAQMMYRDALRAALLEEMRRDPRVFVIGEEVGRYGGAYAVTKGLFEEFGAQRLVDAPISEASTVGLGVGAAITGLRPVVELMYVDFVGLAMDQIANQMAKVRYMTGGQVTVPMVLRTQGGTGRSAGAQHSQSLESWLAHVPGLRVVMPATPADAKGLLKTADPQRRPGGVHRAQGAVRDERRGARRRVPGAVRRGQHRAAGRGRHHHHLLADAPLRHGSGAELSRRRGSRPRSSTCGRSTRWTWTRCSPRSGRRAAPWC